jgi:hypothetical protein
MSRQLSDLLLERFSAHALSPTEHSQIVAILALSPDDEEALRLLRADNEALMLRLPPAAFAERVMPSPRLARRWWLWGGVLTAVASAMLWFVPTEREFESKGNIGFQVTASGTRGTRVVSSHDRVSAGETLSFRVTTAEPMYCAVVSHAPDGFFVYVPTSRVEIGQTLLPQGAQLDATVGDETLFLVCSETAFDAEAARAQLRQSAEGLPWHMETLEIDKNR